MAKVMVAQYSGGWCQECDDPILKGDKISRAVDIWVHAECNDSSQWEDPELTGWNDPDDE